MLACCLLGCDAEKDLDKTAEKACGNATCPPGTTINLSAASGGKCDGGGTVDVTTAEGTVPASCFSSGSCTYACVPPHRCCGMEEWTTTSYRCETPCCEDGAPPPCETACGDGTCDVGENPGTCPQDCDDTCADGDCTGDENPQNCPQDCATTCGDSLCTGSENPETCPADCATTCGDGLCTGSENPGTCPADCATTCGDGLCTGSENPQTCSADCATTCGDSLCTGSENPETCPADCATTCGDGMCTGSENPQTCSADCATTCGDSLCTGSENPQTCPADCATTCGDGLCTGSENPQTCAADCATTCGDGYCTGAEKPATCPQDCGTTCGDGDCNGLETPETCASDCGDTCGDGDCTGAETPVTCPADCAQDPCGNQVCEATESPATCPEDCAKPVTRLSGKVLLSRSLEGVVGANIVTDPLTQSAVTGEGGTYEFELPADFASFLRVSAHKQGYLTSYVDVYVFPEQTNTASIVLVEAEADSDCFPACATGWTCASGSCKSLCGVVCAPGKVCNGQQCVDLLAGDEIAEGCGDGVCSMWWNSSDYSGEFGNDGVSCLPDCPPLFRQYPTGVPPRTYAVENCHVDNSLGSLMDYDQDGDLDVVYVDCEGYSPRYFGLFLIRNAGSAKLGPAWLTPERVGWFLDEAAAKIECTCFGPELVADINHDGAIEALLFLHDDGTMNASPNTFYRNASGDFRRGASLHDGLAISGLGGFTGYDRYFSRMSWLDVDGDGKEELVRDDLSADPDKDELGLRVYANVGTDARPAWSDRTFTMNLPGPEDWTDGFDKQLADIDRDGLADFIYYDRYWLDSLHLEVWHQASPGMWEGPTRYPTVQTLTKQRIPSDLAFVDTDGTGYLNLVVDGYWWTDVVPRLLSGQ